MPYCKTAAFTWLQYWRYKNLVLIHRCIDGLVTVAKLVSWAHSFETTYATGSKLPERRVQYDPSLTLRQWSSSGNPVAIQCAWNLDPSVHWNATGEMPVCFQWSYSGFPVVFQCVPIMQINTRSPLEHHWVLPSASVVPVASQCTCGSSGLPVCSNYAN